VRGRPTRRPGCRRRGTPGAVIISGGRNIYSVEVENALAAHLAVSVVAIVDPLPGQTVTLDELREFGAERLRVLPAAALPTHCLSSVPSPGMCG
jgi:hypothetical protein